MKKHRKYGQGFIDILKKKLLKSLEVDTWILHESEALICKALKGEIVVSYFEPLITQQMRASGSSDVLGVAESEAQRAKINQMK